ncbi:MAG: FtsW/RodA/SpoVE family cell cycle protein [Coriobacteriia bacterium]|nr:FtsW/RodA/SpoVE family cell cycle protein [Coriobacteriia bacterium]
MSSRRNRELMLLAVAAVPVVLLFALVGAQASGNFSWTYLTVPISLFALFAAAHIALRYFAKNADPVLLPVAFVLSSIGIAFITRLTPEKAFTQIAWLFIGVVALIAILAAIPSLERVGNYKYTLMVVGIVLMVLPALIGREINGSKLWIRLGSLSIQPGEIARVLIILFMASYLSENREMLTVSTRRILRIPMPELRTLGPLLFMWAISFLVMVAEKDLGSSLLFFGIFLIMLYVATGRPSYVAIGLVLFSGGATLAYKMFTHVQTRVDIWLHPFQDAAGKGYQLVQSIFAFADGGFIGRGIGAGLPTRIPFVDTDFIFAAIGEELGLLGACAVIICFLVVIYRGISIASRAKSDMASFTAVGLTASLGLQVFVIVGGVTGLIPLTGITLPFISRGGSSMLSTFMLLALLIRASDASTGLSTELVSAQKGTSVLGRLSLSKRLGGLAVFFSLLMVALVGNLTWLQVIHARSLQNNVANTRNLSRELRSARGPIVTSDGVTLAESILQKDGTYKRVYPHKSLAAHTIGYYSTKFGRSGIERIANDVLTGQRTFSTFDDVIGAATNQPIKGDSVTLTIDSKVQKAAEKALEAGSGKGAIVVMNPKTGAVLASASSPTFDPGTVTDEWQKLNTDSNSSLLDRSRQTILAPGSTFKVVTLTGVYANNVATPTTTYKAPASMIIGNAAVTNFEKSSYSRTTLKMATAKSINTVFGQVAVQLGAKRLVAQSEKFGFNSTIPYDLGIETSLMPDPLEMTTWETAWAGIGQPVGEHTSPAGPQATVFQMALIASGIADDGIVMKPYVIKSINSPTGKITGSLSITSPVRWKTACSTDIANQVTDAMKGVVADGSGRGAALLDVTVAGKTGTAEIGKTKTPNAWFIAFAPADNPTVALAIMLENGGQGGKIAAPAARAVLKAALGLH